MNGKEKKYKSNNVLKQEFIINKHMLQYISTQLLPANLYSWMELRTLHSYCITAQLSVFEWGANGKRLEVCK